MENKNRLYLIAIAVLAVALITTVIILCCKNSTLKELVGQMEVEKEQLQEEYQSLNDEFSEYQTDMTIHNDSLVSELSKEQQRVQDLLEELKITKATNAKKIAELKQELASVRATLKEYAKQIDALKAQNQLLMDENSVLQDEKSTLTDVVNRASVLEVTSCSVVKYTKRGAKTPLAGLTRSVGITFHIAKNLAAKEGERVVELKIYDPSNYEVARLYKNFTFYGNAIDLETIWELDKAPKAGEYAVSFSINDVCIGNYSFNL